MRNRLIFFGAALLVAVPLITHRCLVAQDYELRDRLIVIETSLWQGWASNDTVPFKEHLLPEHISVGSWGMDQGKEVVIASIAASDCAVNEYSFQNWKIKRVDDNTVILVYTAEQDVVCSGRKLPEALIVTSTYTLKDGRWLTASYHETPIDSEYRGGRGAVGPRPHAKSGAVL